MVRQASQISLARRRQARNASRSRPARTIRADAASGSHELTGNTEGVVMTVAGKADSVVPTTRGPGRVRASRPDSTGAGGATGAGAGGRGMGAAATCALRPEDPTEAAAGRAVGGGNIPLNNGSTVGSAPGTARGAIGSSALGG